jgi:hypothetical protein
MTSILHKLCQFFYEIRFRFHHLLEVELSCRGGLAENPAASYEEGGGVLFSYSWYFTGVSYSVILQRGRTNANFFS